MGQRGLKQSQTGKRAGFEGCLIKGEKVHKIRIYDTEKKTPVSFLWPALPSRAPD